VNLALLDQIAVSDESQQFKLFAVLRSLPKEYKISFHGGSTVSVLGRASRKRRTFPATFFHRVLKMEAAFAVQKSKDKLPEEQKG